MLHPYLGYVIDPRSAADFPFPVSEYGFHDQRPPTRKRSADKTIIGIFGGSLARNFCHEGGLDDLKQRLAASPPLFAGRELEFVVTALGGYKQPQQLMTLSYLLALGGEFDIILNLDGFNEVALHFAENAKHGVTPVFPRSWSLRVQELPDPVFLRLVGEIVHLRRTREALKDTMANGPWRHSALLKLWRKLRDRRLGDEILKCQLELADYRPPANSPEATGRAPGQADAHQALQQLAAAWKTGSLQMHRLCQANGICYLHFLQPNQYFPGSKQLTPEELDQAYLESHPYQFGVVDGYPLLFEHGRELAIEGVRFHDLTMAYADIAETIYIDTCCHVNQLGDRILADRIARAILADPSSREPSGTGAPPSRRGVAE